MIQVIKEETINFNQKSYNHFYGKQEHKAEYKNNPFHGNKALSFSDITHYFTFIKEKRKDYCLNPFFGLECADPKCNKKEQLCMFMVHIDVFEVSPEKKFFDFLGVILPESC